MYIYIYIYQVVKSYFYGGAYSKKKSITKL